MRHSAKLAETQILGSCRMRVETPISSALVVPRPTRWFHMWAVAQAQCFAPVRIGNVHFRVGSDWTTAQPASSSAARSCHTSKLARDLAAARAAPQQRRWAATSIRCRPPHYTAGPFWVMEMEGRSSDGVSVQQIRACSNYLLETTFSQQIRGKHGHGSCGPKKGERG